jgi:flagellar protein FlbB
VAFGHGGNLIKIILLLLLILLLTAGGLVWFDYLGIINIKERLSPAFNLLGLSAPEEIEETEQPLMLEQERLKKQRTALDLLAEELDNREEEIAKKENEVTQKLETLDEREKTLEEQEKSFNERVKQYDNKRANLRQSAQYFTGMPPQNAVERLLEMDDQDVIDILRTVERMAQEAGEDSVVAYWLSLMPPDRAAQLSRKMIKKPEQ